MEMLAKIRQNSNFKNVAFSAPLSFNLFISLEKNDNWSQSNVIATAISASNSGSEPEETF